MDAYYRLPNARFHRSPIRNQIFATTQHNRTADPLRAMLSTHIHTHAEHSTPPTHRTRTHGRRDNSQSVAIAYSAALYGAIFTGTSAHATSGEVASQRHRTVAP